MFNCGGIVLFQFDCSGAGYGESAVLDFKLVLSSPDVMMHDETSCLSQFAVLDANE